MDEQFYDSNNCNNPYETPSQEIPVYTPPTPKKREKKNRMGLRICALALVFALLYIRCSCNAESFGSFIDIVTVTHP